MSPLSTAISCPSCQGSLQPQVLACARCDLRIEGRFEANEFAGLDERLLHFLRIFVHCEGRIKDMEKALGVSYPTVKSTMAALKEALRLPVEAAAPAAAPAPIGSAASAANDVAAILEAMARGELPYEEALQQIRTRRERP